MLFHDVIGYITIMRLTIDRYITMEGCNFRFPAVAAGVCGNFIAVIIVNIFFDVLANSCIIVFDISTAFILGVGGRGLAWEKQV